MSSDIEKVLNLVSPSLKKVISEKFNEKQKVSFEINNKINNDINDIKKELSLLKKQKSCSQIIIDACNDKINSLQVIKKENEVSVNEIISEIQREVRVEINELAKYLCDQSVNIFNKATHLTKENESYLIMLSKGLTEIDNANFNLTFSKKIKISNTLEKTRELDCYFSKLISFKKLVNSLDLLNKKNNSQTKILVDKSFNHQKERLRLSSICLPSVAEELSYMGGWYITDNKSHKDAQVDMMSYHAEDALRHFKLGRAILSGNKRSIEKALNMDTSPRENIQEDIFDFMDKINSGEISLKKIDKEKNKTTTLKNK